MERMSCLTLPPVEYECDEEEDERETDIGEEEKSYLVNKKRKIYTPLAGYLSFHPGQKRSCDAG